MNKSGILFIISGPAGVGKTTVVNALLNFVPQNKLKRSITATTRNPRPEETNGSHYFFISEKDFQKKIQNDELLEYALVHGNTYYGSLKQEIIRNISQGINILLVIDVQGYFKIIEKHLNIKIVSIFIKPITIETLYTRLINRGTETIPEINNRLHTAKYELQFVNKYKYVINSGTREEDFLKLLNIYNKETEAI